MKTIQSKVRSHTDLLSTNICQKAHAVNK